MSSEHDEQALQTLLAKLASENLGLSRVVQRDFLTPLATHPDVGLSPLAGQLPTKSFGPFKTSSGRSVAVDLLQASSFIGIQRAAQAAPFLYFSTIPLSGNASSIALSAGSVWLAVSQLVPSSPSAAFAGLRIKGGTVSFGSSVPVSTNPIIVPPGAQVLVQLNLLPEVPVTPGVPDGSVVVPTSATFSFQSAGGALVASTAASVKAFGCSVNLTFSPKAAQYDILFDRLIFPFKADQAQFVVSQSKSKIATFSGIAPINLAAWSVPVSTASPSTFGSASGAGGIELVVGGGLQVVTPEFDRPIALGPCSILVEPNDVVVGGKAAKAPKGAQIVGLWGSSTVTFRAVPQAGFRFISGPSGVDLWSIMGNIVASFDQPRAVNSSRFRVAGSGAFELIYNGATITFQAQVSLTANAQTTQAYALKNLLLNVTGPQSVVITGPFVNGDVPAGTAVIGTSLNFLFPFLPDPYAANFSTVPPSPSSPANIQINVVWKPDLPAIIDIIRRNASVAELSEPLSAAKTVQLPARGDPMLQVLSEELPFTSLLDLSTNVSQFGVTLSRGSKPNSLPIKDLYLQAPANVMPVFTLPAVQWEPVITPDQNPPFPSPLSFPNCGTITEISTNSVTLTPVAPRQAIDGILSAYNSAPKNQVRARFTLPFGLVASANLTPHQPTSPAFSQAQPTFTSRNLTGGDQLSIRAGTAPPGQPLTLPGSTTLLQNALSNGQSVTQTVIYPLPSALFNGQFQIGAPSPCVPVTRVDLSGFGESLFSDWRNPSQDAATITKVDLGVIVGRTSREVVQVFSILYPFAVKVVRSIILERQNGAAVTRKDTGWQAVSDGTYDYPHPGLVTHPGVVKGVTNVSNIRDLGPGVVKTTPDASELMGVQFDCTVLMENIVSGQASDGRGGSGVPARNLVGYVQILDPPHHGQLLADQYANLLGTVGPLGGLVDCTIDVGKSGLQMRIVHIGVGVTTGTNGPEFVMSASGAPVLPPGGQWSCVRHVSSAAAPQALDPDQGVPLVRQGPSPATPPASSPYRFADPADLLSTGTPSVDYGIVHSTGTQRLLFPRPKIETTSPFALTSVVPPAFADPYVLGIANGPFPPILACIPFNDANYQLLIRSGGHLTLKLPLPTFTAPPLHRVIQQDTNSRVVAYTQDNDGNRSQVTIVIDTAANPPWSVHVTNLSLATDVGSLGELVRIIGTLDGDANRQMKFIDAQLILGGVLKPASIVLTFLEHFGPLDPLPLSMTNEWSLQYGLHLDLGDILGKLPLLKEFFEKFVETLDFKLLANYSPADGLSLVLGAEIAVKCPVLFLVVIGIGKFELDIGLHNTVWQVTLGLGLGYGFDVIPGITALVYLAGTISFSNLNGVNQGPSGGWIIKGALKVKAIALDVELSCEGKEVYHPVPCADGSTSVFGVIQTVIAVEISVFIVLDIEVDYSWESNRKTNDGTCTLK